MKYSQPNNTAADRATASRRLRFSFMVLYLTSLFRRNGIEARRTAEPGDGMATQQPLARQREAPGRAMNLDRLDGVGRAGWREAALGGQHRGQEPLVEADRCDQRRCGDAARVVVCHGPPCLSCADWSVAAKSSSRPA